MGLAGDYNLHRHGWIRKNSLEPRQIAEHQGGAFIGGEAACETNGQDGGVEQLAGAFHYRRRSVACKGAGDGALAHKSNQAALAAAVRFPQFARGDVAGLLPGLGFIVALAPVRLQVLIVEVRQVAIDPRR